MLEQTWQDIRYGLRLLRRGRFFTATALLSLAIGIGANTTIFSFVSALLLRPMPDILEPERLVDIGRSQDGRGFDNSSYPNYRDVRERATLLSDVYAYRFDVQPVSLVMTALGIGVGLLAGAAAAQVLRSLLFGIPPLDPIAFCGAALLFSILSIAASYIPARRALRVDPMIALRSE